MATKLEINSVPAQKSIEALQKSMLAMNKSVKILATGITALQGKMTGNKAFERLSKKVESQSKAIAALTTRTGNAVKMVALLAKGQASAESKVAKLTTKLAAQTAASTKAAAAAAKTAAAQRKAAASTIKMKNASARASEQFKNMTQSLQQVGAANVSLSNLRRSFSALDAKLKAGKLTPTQYANAMNRWKASMGTASREVKRLGANTRKMGGDLKKAEGKTTGLSKKLRNLGSSAVFAVGPLSGVGARVTAFGAIASRTGIKVAALILLFTGLGVVIIKTITHMARVAIQVNRINNALAAATGSTAAAQREFQFLVATSRELALDLSSVGLQYAQLSAASKGTSLAGAGVRKIFKAVSTAAVVLGLAADQTTGALRAIQQMMSKGTVQAEELRGQLGERIPGAFQIAARAMGVTTRELGKLLERGLVLAEDLLPKMADELIKTFGPQVETAVEQIGASINRLKTEFFLLFKLLEENTGLVQSLASIFNTMAEGVRVVSGVFENNLRSQLEEVNKALADNAEESEKVNRFLKAAQGAWLSSAANVKKYKDQILQLDVAAGLLLVKQGRLNNELTAFNAPDQGPPAQALTFQQLRELPVGPVDKFKTSLQDMRAVLKSLSDPSLSAGDKLGIIDSFTKAGKAAEEVAKIFKKLNKDELAALRLQVDGTSISMEELEDRLLRLVTRNVEMKEAFANTTKELEAQVKAFAKVRENIASLDLQVDALERLNQAQVLGKEAHAQMTLQIAIETALRENNVNSLSKQGMALAELTTRKHEALIVGKELNEAEKEAERIAGLKEQGAEQLENLKQANEVLRLRIDGLFEEARIMEIRNKLEDQYGSILLPKTLEEIVKAKLENDALKNKLEEVDESTEALSNGFKRMGSDLAGGIREGKNLVDVLTNSFGNLLESLLEVAIQLLIIKPLLQSLGLPGGGASPGSIFGIPLPSAKGNAFQGGNVVPFRKGGVVSSPSNFSFGGGIGSIAEQGAEGILPLKRTSSGNLGVEAVGAGGGTTVNFFLAPGESVREFNESQPEIAAMMQGTMSSAAASNG